MKTISRSTIEIDATGQAIGRLAAGIARLLQGKHKTTYTPHIDDGDKVVVKNIDKIRLTGKKTEGKIYYHYSGYPGGMKARQLKDVLQNPEKGGSWVLKKAVYKMLPKNKQRSERIKRLVIS